MLLLAWWPYIHGRTPKPTHVVTTLGTCTITADRTTLADADMVFFYMLGATLHVLRV